MFNLEAALKTFPRGGTYRNETALKYRYTHT